HAPPPAGGAGGAPGGGRGGGGGEGRGRGLFLWRGWYFFTPAESFLDRMTEMPDVLELAPTIRCPTLFIGGDQEDPDTCPAEAFRERAGGPCDIVGGWIARGPRNRPLPDGNWRRTQAAAWRWAGSGASTSATVSSTVAFFMPYCAAIAWTSRSVRSILGAPAKRARAAEDGRTRSNAAAAYFSNGTRSSGDAPSRSQTPQTQL